LVLVAVVVLDIPTAEPEMVVVDTPLVSPAADIILAMVRDVLVEVELNLPVVVMVQQVVGLLDMMVQNTMEVTLEALAVVLAAVVTTVVVALVDTMLWVVVDPVIFIHHVQAQHLFLGLHQIEKFQLMILQIQELWILILMQEEMINPNQLVQELLIQSPHLIKTDL
tara:strand:+ start:65 stop:565 length:501 start_codon:yes stop_codon:yes gene_type:complete